MIVYMRMLPTTTRTMMSYARQDSAHYVALSDEAIMLKQIVPAIGRHVVRPSSTAYSEHSRHPKRLAMITKTVRTSAVVPPCPASVSHLASSRCRAASRRSLVLSNFIWMVCTPDPLKDGFCCAPCHSRARRSVVCVCHTSSARLRSTRQMRHIQSMYAI
jgi:hypothetical protein